MSKKLVAYFSCSGVSKHNAELFSQVLGADIYEIKPKFPYTEADLDWTNEKARSSIEMKNKKIRPEIADKNARAENYDEIYDTFDALIKIMRGGYKVSGPEIIDPKGA